MKKSSILIILIIILFITGFIIYSSFFSQEKIQIGEIEYIIPEGYHKGINNNVNDTNLSNGYNSIFFAKYDGKDVNKYINEITEFINSTNQTAYISNFTANDTFIYKLTIVNNTQYYRYWFVEGNSTYCIYTWDGNTNMDNLATNLIMSRTNSKGFSIF